MMKTFYAVDTEFEGFDDGVEPEFDFQRALQTVGGAVSSHGPQVLAGAGQGAAAGAIGGPWGAALGAGVGVAQSLLAGQSGSPARSPGRPSATPARPTTPATPGRPTTPATPAAPVTRVTPAPAAAPAGSPPGSAGAPASAIHQLFQLLSSAPMQQALAQAPAGAGGSVPVRAGQSTTEVPVAALLGLLGSVAGQAAEEVEYFESDDAYLRFPDGSYRCDPAVESERHSALLELISADAVMLDEGMSPEQWLGNVYFGA